jgi:hypothetical protein
MITDDKDDQDNNNLPEQRVHFSARALVFILWVLLVLERRGDGNGEPHVQLMSSDCLATN